MNLRDYLDTGPDKVSSLAEKVGVCRQTIHKWVTGQRMPRPSQISAIFGATNGQVTPNDFFDLKASKKRVRA